MTVIAISSRSFSGELDLARCLAEQLGFRCVDPEVVLERGAACGPPQDELVDTLLTPPSLLERTMGRKRRCLTLLQAALVQELQTADAVCYGNLAELVPIGSAGVIRLGIEAPLRLRCRLAQDELHFTRVEAVSYLHEMDRTRTKWLRWARCSGLAAPMPPDVVIEELDLAKAVPRVAAAIVDHPQHAVTACDSQYAIGAGLDRPQVSRPGIVRAWAMIALVLCGVLAYSAASLRFADSLFSYFSPISDTETQTVAGVITDTLCGARHKVSASASEAECVKACARLGPGASYALYDGKTLFRLSDGQIASHYAAQRVVVTGRVDNTTKTLHILSIARVS